MTSKIKRKKDIATKWKAKYRKFTTYKNVKVNLCLPEFSVMEVVT